MWTKDTRDQKNWAVSLIFLSFFSCVSFLFFLYSRSSFHFFLYILFFSCEIVSCFFFHCSPFEYPQQTELQWWESEDSSPLSFGKLSFTLVIFSFFAFRFSSCSVDTRVVCVLWLFFLFFRPTDEDILEDCVSFSDGKTHSRARVFFISEHDRCEREREADWESAELLILSAAVGYFGRVTIGDAWALWWSVDGDFETLSIECETTWTDQWNVDWFIKKCSENQHVVTSTNRKIPADVAVSRWGALSLLSQMKSRATCAKRKSQCI